jgi:DNA polymerase-3 subunit epsilon
MNIVTGLDLETTGLDFANGHRIVEVAMLIYDLDTGEFKYPVVQRINPQRPIDAKATERHGITFDQVASCPTFDVIAPKVATLLRHSHVIVTFNGEDFDIPFINTELAREGVEVPPLKAHVDVFKQGRWATFMGKNPNLGELCFACGVAYDKAQAHSAEYDVRVMMQCFFHGFRKGFFSLPAVEPAALAA